MIINLIGSLAKLAIFYMIFTTAIHILTKKMIISPHPRKLGINRAVGTFRSRYRGYRRHRCRRYGVREGLLRTPAAFP